MLIDHIKPPYVIVDIIIVTNSTLFFKFLIFILSTIFTIITISTTLEIVYPLITSLTIEAIIKVV
jgi:uncharacterized membrane-anchored protein YitT (DUF2179 family)